MSRSRLAGVLLLLVAAIVPAQAVTPLEDRFRALLPLRIEDMDYGFVMLLSSDGAVQPETTAHRPYLNGTGTWRVTGSTLTVNVKADDIEPTTRTYPIEFRKGELFIDRLPEGPASVWVVNWPD